MRAARVSSLYAAFPLLVLVKALSTPTHMLCIQPQAHCSAVPAYRCAQTHRHTPLLTCVQSWLSLVLLCVHWPRRVLCVPRCCSSIQYHLYNAGLEASRAACTLIGLISCSLGDTSVLKSQAFFLLCHTLLQASPNLAAPVPTLHHAGEPLLRTASDVRVLDTR